MMCPDGDCANVVAQRRAASQEQAQTIKSAIKSFASHFFPPLHHPTGSGGSNSKSSNSGSSSHSSSTTNGGSGDPPVMSGDGSQAMHDAVVYEFYEYLRAQQNAQGKDPSLVCMNTGCRITLDPNSGWSRSYIDPDIIVYDGPDKKSGEIWEIKPNHEGDALRHDEDQLASFIQYAASKGITLRRGRTYIGGVGQYGEHIVSPASSDVPQDQFLVAYYSDKYYGLVQYWLEPTFTVAPAPEFPPGVCYSSTLDACGNPFVFCNFQCEIPEGFSSFF